MAFPQTGVFALGNPSHTYLELDRADGVEPAALARAVADLSEPRTTMGGVNLVSGFRPELWASIAPDHAAAGLAGFGTDLVGPDGYAMPATQRDLVLWIAGGSYDVVFDAAREMIADLRDVATVRTEVEGWSYHRDLDLTGFIDGTENPSLSAAPMVALVPDGSPGAGGSVLLLQQWVHDFEAWSALPVEQQEKTIGRTKLDSIELDPKSQTSHAARTDQDELGHIFRRNTAYGTVSDHGTMFVGFCAEQRPLVAMLERMVGLDGPRDELTFYSRPLTGGYYFVPALDDLASFAG